VIVCGIDEAGRGPLAGPVTAAAVVLPEVFPREILADSKTLPEKKREAAAEVIRRLARAWCAAEASVEEIDRLGILRASLLAMGRALEGLGLEPDLVLVDGNVRLECRFPCEALVRGDARVPEIMAASILAKTRRDGLMRDLARAHPGYGFAKHKGYPTREHREAIRLLGVCPIHRRSFRLDWFS